MCTSQMCIKQPDIGGTRSQEDAREQLFRYNVKYHSLANISNGNH